MKKTIIWLFSLLCCPVTQAVDLGALDTSFSADDVTDGYAVYNESGFNRYGADVLVDSQGRLYVVGTYDYEFNGQTEKGARLERWLANGQPDNSFSGDGVMELVMPPAPGNQFEYELALDSSDGVFIGYSRLFCATANQCESDLYVYHVNANGVVVGSQQIDFDLGATPDRIDDDFADLVYVPAINKLAVAATVERSGLDDTDLGIAVLNADPVSGALSVDTGFDSDGKNLCWFDQANPSGSADRAAAIIYHPIKQSFIVGGSAFEGNGINGDGWNMAFCEFSLSGVRLDTWSSMSTTPALESQEFVADMAYEFDTFNGAGVFVAATVSGNGGHDLALFRYQLDIMDQWSLDPGFGTNGVTTVGFQYLFVGDTDDYARELVIEADGAMVVAGSLNWQDNNQLAHAAVGLARFSKNGHLDTNWGIGQSGKAVHTFNLISQWDQVDGLAYDPVSEDLYITGWSYNGEFQSLLANFHNDMIFGNNLDF
jgi:hypothetical protein